MVGDLNASLKRYLAIRKVYERTLSFFDAPFTFCCDTLLCRLYLVQTLFSVKTLFEQYSAKRLYGNQISVDNLIRQYAFTGDRLALPHVECLQGQYYSKRKLWQPQVRIQHDFESSGKKQVLIDTFDNRIDEALQIDPDTAHKTVFFQNFVRVSFW